MLQASRPVATVHHPRQPYVAPTGTMPPKKSPHEAAPASSSAPNMHPKTSSNLRRSFLAQPSLPDDSQFNNPAVGPIGASVEGISRSGKIALPKLRRESDYNAGTNSGNKKRTSRACAECRARKIKCSGRQPTCDHCELSQLPCIYVEGKREHNKK